MPPILLCQLDHSPSPHPHSLDGVVGGQVLGSEDVSLLKPLLLVLQSAILSLALPVLHGVSSCAVDRLLPYCLGNSRFRLTSMSPGNSTLADIRTHKNIYEIL